MKFNFKIDDSLLQIVKIGVIQFDNLIVKPKIDQLDIEIEQFCKQLITQYPTLSDASENIKIMRSLYKAIGLDPTKNRPSSEALLRRVLQGKGLYQINSIVDICNLCSLSFYLSIGLYDVDKIVGDEIALRLGRENEGFSGIRKDFINVKGKLTLVDQQGPFGNPSADSDRTKITVDTQKAMFVLFAPVQYDNDRLLEHLNYVEEKVKQYHVGSQTVFKQTF